jgi:hypothetical protein
MNSNSWWSLIIGATEGALAEQPLVLTGPYSHTVAISVTHHAHSTRHRNCDCNQCLLRPSAKRPNLLVHHTPSHTDSRAFCEQQLMTAHIIQLRF